MQSGHGHQYRKHQLLLNFNVNAACHSTCCLSISMLHAHVHTEFSCPYLWPTCPCPCCKSMSMQDDHFHSACPCPCCMSMSMLHLQVHAAWNRHLPGTWKCSMDIGMQHGRRHLAWTEACSMDMDTWREDGQVLGQPLIFVSSPIQRISGSGTLDFR